MVKTHGFPYHRPVPWVPARQDRVTSASAATLRGQGWNPGAEGKEAVPGRPSRTRRMVRSDPVFCRFLVVFVVIWLGMDFYN